MSLVGSLEDLGLGDILQIVSLSRKSGVLNLSWGDVKGKIIFRDGQVVAATSTEEKQSLADILAAQGALSRDAQLTADNAMASLADAPAIAGALARDYQVDPAVIESNIQDRIQAVVFQFFTWPEGNFSFELQEIEPELEGLKHPDKAFVLEVGLSPQFLAMEGTRIQDERRRDRAEAPVGPPRAKEPEKAAAPPPPEPPRQEREEPPAPSPAAGAEMEEDFSSVADAVAFYESKGREGGAEETPPPAADEPAPSHEEPAPAPSSAASLEPEPEVSGPIVVVADDDDIMLRSIEHFLQPKGYSVFSFTKISPAIFKIQQLVDMGERPRVLIADLLMPDTTGASTLGGLELLEKTRKINPAISIYMTSDYENLPAREKAEDLGARFFFMKPKASQLDESFDSPELVNFIQVLNAALESEAPLEGAKAPAAEGEGLINLGEELRKEFGEEVSPGAPEAEEIVPSRGLHMLKAMISELNDPGSNGQITLMILRFAAEMMNRAVIFLVAKNQLAGLGQFGIVLDGADPQKHVRLIRIPLNEPSIFREAIQKRMPLKKNLKMNKWNEYLVNHLGGIPPREVFVAPIIAGGKIPAILYGDNVPEDKEIGDTESLEIFLAQAGLAMEKALLERRLREMGTNSD